MTTYWREVTKVHWSHQNRDHAHITGVEFTRPDDQCKPLQLDASHVLTRIANGNQFVVQDGDLLVLVRPQPCSICKAPVLPFRLKNPPALLPL
jgi:hypothetical protein